MKMVNKVHYTGLFFGNGLFIDGYFLSLSFLRFLTKFPLKLREIGKKLFLMCSGSMPSRSRSRSRSRSHNRERRHSGGRRDHSRSPMSNRRRHQGNRDEPEPSKCLGVFGLSLYTNERELEAEFKKFGPLEKVQVVLDGHTGRSRGFAFIYYENQV